MRRVILRGDNDIAQTHMHDANVLEFQLHEQMRLNTAVKQRQMTRTFDDGTVITASSIFGLEMIHIYSPSVKQIQANPEIRTLPVMAQFENGKIFFEVGQEPTANWYIDLEELSGLDMSLGLVGIHGLAVIEYDPTHGVAVLKNGALGGGGYGQWFVVVRFRATSLTSILAYRDAVPYRKANAEYDVSIVTDPQANFPESVNPATPFMGISQLKGLHCWQNEYQPGISNLRWEMALETLTKWMVGEPFENPEKTVSIVNSSGSVRYENPYRPGRTAYEDHVLAAHGIPGPAGVVWNYLISHFSFSTYIQELSAVIEGTDIPLPDHVSTVLYGHPYYGYMGISPQWAGGLLYVYTALTPWCGSVGGGLCASHRYSMILGSHTLHNLYLPPEENYATEPGKSNKKGYFIGGTYYPEEAALPENSPPSEKVGKELWIAQERFQLKDLPTLTSVGNQVELSSFLEVVATGIHPDYPDSPLIGRAYYNPNNSGIPADADRIGKWSSLFSFACIDTRDLLPGETP